MPSFQMSPADLFFLECDPLAEVVEQAGLAALIREWRRAIDGDGAEHARSQRPPRPRPVAGRIRP
jgi:hypothetical protein